MLGALIGTAFWWGLYLLVFRRDRRRLRNGLLLLIALYSSMCTLALLVQSSLPLGGLRVLAAGLLEPLGVLGLAVCMVANGLTMLRKEGRSLGSLLSGLVGLALLGAPVVAWLLVSTLTPVGLGAGALLALLSLHMGLAFLVFLCASVPYQLFPEK